MNSEESSDYRKNPELVHKALDTIFTRCYRHPGHRILDRKNDQWNRDDAEEGVVQDAEFGLILLSAREWLARKGSLAGSIAHKGKVQEILVELSERIVNRVLCPSKAERKEDVGAKRIDVAFFSTKPYANAVRPEGNTQKHVYPSNLDSAMLILAFLASALEQYGDVMHERSWSSSREDEQTLSSLDSLRDAALLVCKEALRYAGDCQIGSFDDFKGYTCSPQDRQRESQISKHDRLFFTWTTCETVRELRRWVSYLERIASTESETANALATAIREELSKRETSISQAGTWCEKEFYSSFTSLERVNVSVIVDKLSAESISEEGESEDELSEKLTEYVHHVYHLAQYIAIRSLSPSAVTISELRNVCERLHVLVERDILQSGLDESEVPRLFQSLTRYYSFDEGPDRYPDDAWYPLVVRSFAAVLERVAAEFSDQAEAEEFLGWLRGTLLFHYRELVKRRPNPKEEGDQYLWSYATGQEYLLYATQRTIFALIKSMDALESTQGHGDVDQFRDGLRRVLADSIASTLLKDSFDRWVSEARQILSLPEVRDGGNGLPAGLAETAWAGRAVSRWLQELSDEFVQVQEKLLSPFLKQNARSLVKFRSYAAEFQENEDQDSREAKGALEVLNQIKECEWIGEQLSDLDENGQWSVEDVFPLLFEYLFRQYVSCDAASLRELAKSRPELRTGLWDLITQAKLIQQGQGTTKRRIRAK